MKYFVSDNASGVHPEVLAAIAAANDGHAVAYGHDEDTERARQTLRRHFGAHVEVLFALTGTGANVVALQSVLHSYQSIICADYAHLHRDECGAPEKFIGAKLLPAPTRKGKLTPELIAPLLADTSRVHRTQPRVVTVSQCTEWGTVYTPAELTALSKFCHDNNLLLHVDGARLCNAAVALDLPLKAITADCGVDILSFGGTKNGLMGAEAIIFFNPELAKTAAFFRKQAMQLPSKMRFIAVQFETLFASDLWQRNAAHANAMATRLAAAIDAIDSLHIVAPVESNAIFAQLPPECIAKLQALTVFAVWNTPQSIVRWMTSFDTTENEVDQFAEQIRRVMHDA